MNKTYLMSPLAAEMRVGSQSEMCMTSVDTHPLGKKGLQINPAPRTPPSQSVFFTFRNYETLTNMFLNQYNNEQLTIPDEILLPLYIVWLFFYHTRYKM